MEMMHIRLMINIGVNTLEVIFSCLVSCYFQVQEVAILHLNIYNGVGACCLLINGRGGYLIEKIFQHLCFMALANEVDTI